MSAAELVIGRAYVLRGLSDSKRPDMVSSTRRPPAVARLEGIEGDVIIVRLAMVRGRRNPWCPQSRRALVANVAREATRREVVLAMPVDPLPAVQS